MSLGLGSKFIRRKNGQRDDYVDFVLRFPEQCWVARKTVNGVMHELKLPLLTELDIEKWQNNLCPAVPASDSFITPCRYYDVITPANVLQTRVNEVTGKTEYKVSFYEIPAQLWLTDCFEKIIDHSEEKEGRTCDCTHSHCVKIQNLLKKEEEEELKKQQEVDDDDEDM